MSVTGLTMQYDENLNADRWYMTVGGTNVEIPKEVHDNLIRIGMRKDVTE